MGTVEASQAPGLRPPNTGRDYPLPADLPPSGRPGAAVGRSVPGAVRVASTRCIASVRPVSLLWDLVARLRPRPLRAMQSLDADCFLLQKAVPLPELRHQALAAFRRAPAYKRAAGASPPARRLEHSEAASGLLSLRPCTHEAPLYCRMERLARGSCRPASWR